MVKIPHADPVYTGICSEKKAGAREIGIKQKTRMKDR
jgi:hypothetical protein